MALPPSQVSSLPISDNPITAIYLGDSNYAGSQTAAVPVTVNMASATVSLSTFPVSPSRAARSHSRRPWPRPALRAGTPTGTVHVLQRHLDDGEPRKRSRRRGHVQTSTLAGRHRLDYRDLQW